jgi:hypothetical protein
MSTVRPTGGSDGAQGPEDLQQQLAELYAKQDAAESYIERAAQALIAAHGDAAQSIIASARARFPEAVACAEEMRSMCERLGVTVPDPAPEREATKTTEKKTTEKKALAQAAPTTYKPARREKREFFQVSNKFFDWQLKMPPVFRLIWADLHRHANGREGRQAKVATMRVAQDCNVHKVTAGQAIRYLAHVGAIVTMAEPKMVPDGAGRVRWSKGRYYVPPTSTLDLDDLRQRVETAPKEMLRLRPDERRNRNRLDTMK